MPHRGQWPRTCLPNKPKDMSQLSQPAKSHRGLTLLELTVALGIWLLLSTGVFALWRHTSNATLNTLSQQSALENARGAMDALVVNAQLAHTITLQHAPDGHMLSTLTLTERNPLGQLHNYVFDFNPHTHILRFGANEFASGIARIDVIYVKNRRLDIMIQTACFEPMVLHGSVDVRYKLVIVAP